MQALRFELYPDAITTEGLVTALEKLVAAFRARTGIALAFTNESSARTSPERELALFRITQEALSNISRHARATAAALRIEEDDGALHVTISDNGSGFDPAAPVVTAADGWDGGMGLDAMRTRATAMGLTLRIDSASGAGATIAVTAPLSAEQLRPSRSTLPS